MSAKLKQAECIDCGKEIQIHIYASKAKAKCEACKEGAAEAAPENSNMLEVSEHGPRIDGRPNKALEKLCCPYHTEEPMKVIGVTKSPMWGDLVSLQCRVPNCWLLVQISEQSRKHGPIRTRSHGDGMEPDVSPSELKMMLANGEASDWWNQEN